MRRRMFNLLAGISLTLCVTSISVWKFPPKHFYVRFNLLGHPVNIFTGIPGRVQLRLYAAGFINVSKAGMNLDPRDTGFDTGRFHHLSHVFTWASGYTVENISANSPVIVPARPWRAIDFPFYFPAVLLGLCAVSFVFLSIKMRPQAKGHCRVCGYDLRATPDRCPECGEVPKKTEAKV